MTAIESALNLHRQGFIDEALQAYQIHLEMHPSDPIAMYGVGSIYLSRGQLSGYEIAKQAIFSEQSSPLNIVMAAESVVVLLLQYQYQDHARQFLSECEARKIHSPKISDLCRTVQIPEYLQITAFDQQLNQTLERYHPIESSHYVYAIDIVGGCNLRCPTCPVANSGPMPKGLMSLNLYDMILKKICQESPDANPDIWLFNWTEPMLHPEIDQFIELTHAYGLTSFISTNLNIGDRIEKIMRAQPNRLKVSLSSLKQETYSKTHARGNITQVIDNLYELAKYRDLYESKTKIWIGHHLYKNTLDEQEEIKSLAQCLGFSYAPSPAILAPIEAVMKMMRGQVSDEIRDLRPQFLYDPLQIREEMSRKRSGRKDCELRFNMMAIQHDGLVNLCCATTQTLSQSGVYFLEHSHREIEQMKYQSAFCKQCIAANLHLTIADQ